MRLRVDVGADGPSLRWEDVHGAARGVLYNLLTSQDSELARSLHDDGWRGQRLKPVGMAAPQFAGAPRLRGVYATSHRGEVWFGSPVPEIADLLAASLAARRELRWGSTRLPIHGVRAEGGEPPADGVVELSTVTPVILKDTAERYLLPEDTEYPGRLGANLAHKANVLGLPPPDCLRVLSHGPRRRFAVRGAPRIGAQVRVAVEADGRFVAALRSWGLGLDNTQGFGWIR